MNRHPERDPERVRLLVECAVYYGREPSEAVIETYLGDLCDVPSETLREAIRAHRNDPERGRFWPLVADLRAKLPADNLHLTADAAWAIALHSYDERASVVWTAEIEQARNLARPVWETGDKIGARMAFRSAYETLLARAGAVRWKLSVGTDPTQRAEAVQEARAAGLIGAQQAAQLLPYLGEVTDAGMAEVAGLLAGKVVEFPRGGKDGVSKLREAVTAGLERAKKREEEQEARRLAELERTRVERLERLRELEAQTARLLAEAPKIALPEERSA